MKKEEEDILYRVYLLIYAYEQSLTRACLISSTPSTLLLGSICKTLFRSARPPQRVDGLAPFGDNRKVSFP